MRKTKKDGIENRWLYMHRFRYDDKWLTDNVNVDFKKLIKNSWISMKFMQLWNDLPIVKIGLICYSENAVKWNNSIYKFKIYDEVMTEN